MEIAKPEKKFQAGAITATVWKNTKQNKEGETYDYFSISLQRTYKDKEGNWKNTGYFRLSDLPKAQLVINKVFEDLSLKA